MFRLLLGIGLVVFGVVFLARREWLIGTPAVLIGLAIADSRSKGGLSDNNTFDSGEGGDAGGGGDGGGGGD